MENKSLKTLEYTKILAMLEQYAKNDAAKERARSLKPSGSYREVEKNLLETDAAVTMSLKYGAPNILRVEDPSEAFKRLEIGGALSMAELLNIARLLRAARILKRYTKEQTGILSEYFGELIPNKAFENRITTSIISEK